MGRRKTPVASSTRMSGSTLHVLKPAIHSKPITHSKSITHSKPSKLSTKHSRKTCFISKLAEQKKSWKTKPSPKKALADWDGLKAALTGDIDASVELTTNSSALKTVASSTTQVSQKPVSQGARQKQNQQDISHFRKVLAHSQFRANPISTIQMHLKNTI
ncbi:hypothetical protein QVD99_004359 [Batrachochytrium dendrobatidis]|nr:hypothetical protein O5D80_002110 [Batrachochytrium dendrobatidis]KAK5669989.1 hypothetical protein QVD99_004359 [Batrachochytrium dendrobatidis]